MRQSKKRFIYMVIVGILISFLLDFVMQNKIQHQNKFFDLLTSILITIIVWEGNLRIDHWMNLKFPWVSSPAKRILFHLPVSMLYSAFTIYISMLGFNKYVCSFPDSAKNAFMLTSVVIGVIVSITILSVEVGVQFFNHWKTSLVEVEKYKTESVQAQLQNLKNQVNPHFLFNNLSVLSSLVYKDQDKAVDFINQLSKVYRYLLDNRNSELVPLDEELKFIYSYVYLLQIRFDTNISFIIDIPPQQRRLYLPPMALQILLENAIKHNEISSEQPLRVNITGGDNQLEVKNNLQLRINHEPSSNSGLKNISERYKYYTDRPVEVIQDTQFFIVRIPLLQNV